MLPRFETQYGQIRTRFIYGIHSFIPLNLLTQFAVATERERNIKCSSFTFCLYGREEDEGEGMKHLTMMYLSILKYFVLKSCRFFVLVLQKKKNQSHSKTCCSIRHKKSLQQVAHFIQKCHKSSVTPLCNTQSGWMSEWILELEVLHTHRKQEVRNLRLLFMA